MCQITAAVFKLQIIKWLTHKWTKNIQNWIAEKDSKNMFDYAIIHKFTFITHDEVLFIFRRKIILR